ncbi:MAG: hypothetical protein DME24_14040 [Verrucomicrobia bacterium]|nr:MAG: hypothetical protein DME24_14040 [Verrucomicrobiota bacterium]
MAIPQRHAGSQQLSAGLRFRQGPDQRHRPLAHEFPTRQQRRISCSSGPADQHRVVVHPGLSAAREGCVLWSGSFLPGRRRLFHDAHAGRAQFTVGTGFSTKVQFAAEGGTFTTAFALGLWTASTNAAIRFTLDGSAPTETSTLYTGPINITNSVQVRARSWEAGLLPGPLHSESYVLLNPNVINFTTDLPVIVIHTFGGGGIPAVGSKFASLSFYEPQNGKTSLTNAPRLSTRAGLRVRGSSTAGLAKQSWAVEFWDDLNDDKNLSPLGLPAESDWVLYAPNSFEPVLIHNPFIFDLSNQIGRYAPRTRLVEVYINTTVRDED